MKEGARATAPPVNSAFTALEVELLVLDPVPVDTVAANVAVEGDEAAWTALELPPAGGRDAVCIAIAASM